MGVVHVAAAFVRGDTLLQVLIKDGLIHRTPRVAALQVGHGDVGVEAMEGPAGLVAAVPTRLVVPGALMGGVVEVTEHGAQVWGPPEDTGALFCALLRVGRHSGAEALTVAARVAGAGIVHAGLVEGLGVHLAVADAEHGALDEAALLLGPGVAVWVLGAGLGGRGHVRAGGSLFPAVPEVQLAVHHHVVPRGEVIVGAAVKVPTQPAHRALVGRRQLDEDGCPLVPDDDDADTGLHHQVQAHLARSVTHVVALVTLDDHAMPVLQLQLCPP